MAKVEKVNIVKLELTEDEFEIIKDAMANCGCRSIAVENKQLEVLHALEA